MPFSHLLTSADRNMISGLASHLRPRLDEVQDADKHLLLAQVIKALINDTLGHEPPAWPSFLATTASGHVFRRCQDFRAGTIRGAE